MPERTVRQVLATYTDEDGAPRYALAGETVSVHDDDVKRFDEDQGDEPEDKPAKKAPAKKTSGSR